MTETYDFQLYQRALKGDDTRPPKENHNEPCATAPMEHTGRRLHLDLLGRSMYYPCLVHAAISRHLRNSTNINKNKKVKKTTITQNKQKQNKKPNKPKISKRVKQKKQLLKQSGKKQWKTLEIHRKPYKQNGPKNTTQKPNMFYNPPHPPKKKRKHHDHDRSTLQTYLRPWWRW